jgi:hypothetical protein
MAKQGQADSTPAPATASGSASGSSGETVTAAGGRQVRMRIDDRNLTTSYANAFRTNSTQEEVVLDFGLNLMTQPARDGAGQQGQGEILFQVDRRIILNYYSAKRLAATLSQIVRRHEEQFGEIQVNPAQRQKK